jgi:small subunit ribosomal protein MRP21
MLSTSARSSIRRHAILSSPRSKPFVCHACRQFSVQAPRWQQRASKNPPRSQFNWDPTNSPSTSLPQRQDTVDRADIDMLNDAMDFSPTPGVAAQRNQHFKSSKARAAPTLQYSDEQLGGSSVTDAINAFQMPVDWAQPRQPANSVARTSQSADLMFPERIRGGLVPDLAAPIARPRVLHELNIHLSPGTGRTIDVDEKNPTDLGLRLRQLDMLVARNRIRADTFRQKFHERGGLKRKRLASERWRKRFRIQFANTVTRVQELKRKGW